MQATLPHGNDDDAFKGISHDFQEILYHKQVSVLLDQIAGQHDIRIVFSAEAGSRSWGLQSAHSDFDARFIYMHPPQWYLSIAQGRKQTMEIKMSSIPPSSSSSSQPETQKEKKDSADSKEGSEGSVPPASAPVLWDFFGWDLPKALTLLRESNPALIDWLRSPVVYKAEGSFLQKALDLAERYFQTRTLAHHYLNMAKKHHKLYFENVGRESDEVKLKKYFFVLRPLHCIEWLRERENEHQLPPLSFEETLAQLSNNIPQQTLTEIQSLVKRKQNETLGVGKRLPLLDQWISDLFQMADTFCKKLKNSGTLMSQLPPIEAFDELFYETVMQQQQ